MSLPPLPPRGSTDWYTHYAALDSEVRALSGATSVKAFGAKGDGSTDDTAAFQSALSAGSITIPGGTYRVGKITHIGDSRDIIFTEPATIIQTDKSGVFDLRGQWQSLGTVANLSYATTSLVDPGESTPSSTNVRYTSLRMSSPVTLKKGDVLKIISDDVPIYARDANGGLRFGEYVMTGKDVQNGLDVVLTERLPEQSSYTTNVRLAKLSSATFRIAGPGTIEADPAVLTQSTWGACVSLRGSQFSTLSGLTFRNIPGRAVANSSYSTNVDSCTFINLQNRPSLSHYGYGVMDGGRGLRMTNCHGQNLRHLYSEGNNDAASQGEWDFSGGGHFALITNCVGMNCQSQPFDTHGSAYGTQFVGCKSIGTFIGASSGGGGFSFRGQYITAISCVSDGDFVGFGLRGHGMVLVDPVVRRAEHAAVSIDGDSDDATRVTDIKGIRVIGGTLESSHPYVTVKIGRDGYNMAVDFTGTTIVPLDPAEGHAAFRSYGNAINNVTLKDITYDLRMASTTSRASYVMSGTPGVMLTDGLRIFTTDNSASVKLISWPDATGNQARVEVLNVDHQHLGTNNQPLDISISGPWVIPPRYSYASSLNNQATQRRSSGDITLSVSSGATVPLANNATPVINVLLTGSSSGTIPLADLAAGFPTQQVIFANSSSATVTVQNGSIQIPPSSSAHLVYTQNSWRKI